ncbi:MAG: FtsX-like permease family protein [Bacteroidetes bacterium]|nr:MAG: FtsX-like permease family protein [Bacteroidota bacterium]
MLRRLLYNFVIALEAIGQNKLRAFLTSLGIIFGVASVIAMLAIGRGAQAQILQQMEALGVNNIIIEPIVEQQDESLEEREEDSPDEAGDVPQRFSPGLTLEDARSLQDLPFIEAISAEVVLETYALRQARRRSVKLVGVDNAYFERGGFSLQEGTLFQAVHLETSQPVCIIGHDAKARFFPTEEALGARIKVGAHWLTVVGVLAPRSIAREVRSELGIRNYDLDIYAPLPTVLLRYTDRARVTRDDLARARREESEDNGVERVAVNYHQLDRLTLHVADTRYLFHLAEITRRRLTRRHNEVVDFEITVPEQLLQQKQETTAIFNLVLGAIASISLIVGGIGIMNIMLASVLERIREIGLRLALGATQQDIVLQFMGEAVAMSLSGGILGIVLGTTFSLIIERTAGIPTMVSPYAILLSFFVATSVGLIFGIYPARQAARQDPVVSLRSQ